MTENKIQAATAAKREISSKNGNKTLQDYMKSMEGEIKKALPSVLTPERFTRITLTALSSNPRLRECTPQSFLGAMMSAAQLGLEPNSQLGQAYLIPFRNNGKGCMECQFQIGYKGMIDLFYRSSEASSLTAQVVYENDTFEYELGLEPKLRHIPAEGDRGQAVKVYAVFHLKNGGYGFEVMSMDDVKKHAKRYSKSFGNGPWQTNFEEMAKKTVLKRCLKMAPMSTDFARAISQDETVKTEISEDMYEVANETEYSVMEAEDGELEQQIQE